MILVSLHVTQEEFPNFESDISFLFPKYTLTTKESPNIKFKVVSIQEYPTMSDSNIPILTPISIHQMIDKNINVSKFVFPLHGFINLHLYQRKIAFSGFGSSKQKLKDMASRMGAIVEPNISKKTSLLVSKTLKSDMAQYALRYNIPIVQDKFIFDLFESKEILNEDNYKLKLFSGLFFTASCYGKNEKEELIRYITENGGTFRDGLYLTNTIVISKPSYASKKFKKAFDMKQIIITDNFKEIYSTPESLRNVTIPPLIPSDLFNSMTFYISKKLEHSYPNAFLELKILIRQHGGQIINIMDSANYIIQMDMEKDNYIESHTQSGRESQSRSYKNKSYANVNSHNSNSTSISTSSNNDPTKLCFRTPIWVERCVEEGLILPPTDFHLFIPTSRSKRNGNFHVSLTGFSGNEYLNLNSTLKWLDMRYSTRFKKSMTHLIAKENYTSKKTQAAKEWDIPIVGTDWLFNIAEGNLTNEALSNPWSPRRSQKAEPINENQKNSFNLNISEDDDDDIEILENIPKEKEINQIHNVSQQNQAIISQKKLDDIAPNNQNQNNSSFILSNSSSQQIPPSPKKIQLGSSNLSSINTKSQPKNAISFLDDDDDDDVDFAEVCEELAPSKLSQKDIQKLESNVIICNNYKKEEDNSQRKSNLVKANSTTNVNPIQNLSPKVSQAPLAQSQMSPKHIQPNQTKKNPIFLSSSSEDDDEDYLSYLDQPPASSKAVTNNIHQLPQSQNSSVKTFASGNNQNTNIKTTSIGNNNSSITNNYNNNNQKINVNRSLSSNNNFQSVANNNDSSKVSINRSLSTNSGIQSNFVNVKKEDVKPNVQSFKSNGLDDRATLRPARLQESKEINYTSDLPATPKNNSFARLDKTITPPTAFQQQQGQNHPNQNLFEINMRQPSPPPPSSVYHQSQKLSNINNNTLNSLQNGTSNNISPQKAGTLTENSLNGVCKQPQQPLKNKQVEKFLDDDDDEDDFAEIEDIETHVKIADATQCILKVSAKGKKKKNRINKIVSKKGYGAALNDHFHDADSDSQFDTLETFTQRPNDYENDETRIVSYDETDEPKRGTILVDDEDPFLSLLQK